MSIDWNKAYQVLGVFVEPDGEASTGTAEQAATPTASPPKGVDADGSTVTMTRMTDSPLFKWGVIGGGLLLVVILLIVLSKD